jgi:hypothetical protein
MRLHRWPEWRLRRTHDGVHRMPVAAGNARAIRPTVHHLNIIGLLPFFCHAASSAHKRQMPDVELRPEENRLDVAMRPLARPREMVSSFEALGDGAMLVARFILLVVAPIVAAGLCSPFGPMMIAPAPGLARQAEAAA